MVVLHKPLHDSYIRHRLLVVALEEEPSLVAEHPWFEDEDPGQRRRNFFERIHRRANCLNCIHQNTFSRKSCSRYAPYVLFFIELPICSTCSAVM